MEDEKEQAPDAERAAKERQSQAGRRNITEFNASRNGRPALAHGIHTVVNSGGAELPDLPGAREAAERVDARLAEYISDLGGPEQVTAGQRTILAALRVTLLVLELSARYLIENGLLDSKGRPHGLVAVVNSYGNSARLHSLALGLARKSRDVTPPTLDAVLEEYRVKRQGESKESHEEHQTS